MAEFELRTYVDENGRVPFETWILQLDEQAQAKVAIVLSRLQSPMGELQVAQERDTEMSECWK